MHKQPYFYWHLELSSKCSLKCPRCPRTMQPNKFKVTELDLDFIKKVFTPEVLAKTKRLLLCGGEGDPIYCKEIIEIIQFFKDYNPDISFIIVTNGSYKTTEWWKRLANTLNQVDVIVFSVDGWDQESNNKYRVNSNYESILNGIRTVSSTNPDIKIQWSTILFKFNEDKIDLIKQVAKDAGANTFNLVKSGLFGSKNKTFIDKKLGYDPLEPSSDISDFEHSDRTFKTDLNSTKFSSHRNSVYQNFSKEIEENYIKIKDSYKKDILPGCLIGERGLYVTASGILYPCSWLSHPFNSKESIDKTRITEWDDSYFVKYREDFNLHKKSLFEIINSERWNRIQKGFTCEKTPLIDCERKCNPQATLSRLKPVINL